jgi:hypothetical protein
MYTLMPEGAILKKLRHLLARCRTSATTGWSYDKLWGAMKVYGYTNLLMNGYNQKNDWRWP